MELLILIASGVLAHGDAIFHTHVKTSDCRRNLFPLVKDTPSPHEAKLANDITNQGFLDSGNVNGKFNFAFGGGGGVALRTSQASFGKMFPAAVALEVLCASICAFCF